MARVNAQKLLNEAKSTYLALQTMGGTPARDFGKSMAAIIGKLEASLTQVEQANQNRASLVRVKDADATELSALLKRTRNAVGVAFGDDSNEYQLVGRTRLSERKRPRRKPAQAKGTDANG